jgi:hypothetical protein
MACQWARPDQDYGATRIRRLHLGRGARRRHLVCTRWALSPHRKEAIGTNTYPCGRNWEVSWTLRRTGDGGQRRPCLGVASRGTRGLAWLHHCKTSDLSPAGPHDASRIPFLRRLRVGERSERKTVEALQRLRGPRRILSRPIAESSAVPYGLSQDLLD